MPRLDKDGARGYNKSTKRAQPVDGYSQNVMSEFDRHCLEAGAVIFFCISE